MNPQVYHHSDIIFQRHSITPNSSKSLLRRPAAEYLPSNTTIFSDDEPLPYTELLPSAERTVKAEVELLVDW
jgi:hypothetical protein